MTVTALRAALAIAASVLTACATPTSETATDLDTGEVRASFADGVLIVDGTIGDLDDETVLAKRLRHGVRHVLELRVDAVDDTSLRVLGTWRQRCVVSHDAWTRHFAIERRIREDGAVADGHVEALDGLSSDEVVEVCLALEHVTFAARDAGGFAGRAVHAEVVARLDPPTSDDIHRLRHWIANPDATDAVVPSVFGLVAQLFVNRGGLEPVRTSRHVTASVAAP